MASTTVEREVIGLEQKFWQALKDGDTDTAVSLTDEPCLLTGAQGVGSLDRATLREMFKHPSYTLKAFALKDPRVRVLSDDVAIIAYDVHEELMVDGKPLSLDAAESSTWVRRDGQWLCAQHSETLAGDPFGRDRKS